MHRKAPASDVIRRVGFLCLRSLVNFGSSPFGSIAFTNRLKYLDGLPSKMPLERCHLHEVRGDLTKRHR